MKKGKLILGYALILLAAIITATGSLTTLAINFSELIVKAISAAEMPRETALFWLNASYLGVWALRLGALGVLIYFSFIGWEIQCVRWNSKKK